MNSEFVPDTIAEIEGLLDVNRDFCKEAGWKPERIFKSAKGQASDRLRWHKSTFGGDAELYGISLEHRFVNRGGAYFIG